MKKIYTLLFAVIISQQITNAQAFCDSTANVIIYSNYDGGIININVDKNIPNLKIGITTYESVKITVSGTYSSNITALWYAGYNGNNDNCALGITNTSISGVPANVDSIIIYPPAGYSNANGWPNIVCNYSCSNTTNQGGCNTPDQIVSYFTTHFGGTLNYHHTQYNCWTNTTYSVSTGGNCCIMPATNIQSVTDKKVNVFPNPANDKIYIETKGIGENEIYLSDVLGNKVAFGRGQIKTENLPNGIYFVCIETESGLLTRKVVVRH